MHRNEQTQEIFFEVNDAGELKDLFKSTLNETKAGQKYKADYYSSERDDTDQILEALNLLYGASDYASVNQVASVLNTLMLSGSIPKNDPDVEEPLESPVEDTRPRSKTGKLLTAEQLAWGEMTKFANESSMDAIRQRKYVDPKFRSFVETNMKREFAEQEVGDAVVNLNANKPRETHGAITEEERAFARKWNLLSVAESKKLLSPAMNPEGPEAAARAQRLLNLVSSYGLV